MLRDVPFIPYLQIRDQAETFRKNYCQPGIPVEIENVIDLSMNELELIPIPGLQALADMEALLCASLEIIIVDQDRFMEDRFVNRMRFSLAHELGHYVLHKHICHHFRPDTTASTEEAIEEWIKTQISTPDSVRGKLEYQASEFAGRLLVPKDVLIESTRQYRDEISQYIGMFPDSDMVDLGESLAGKMHRKFGISSDVISIRLQREGILENIRSLI